MVGAIKCTTIFFFEGFEDIMEIRNLRTCSPRDQGRKTRGQQQRARPASPRRFGNHGVNRSKFRSTGKIKHNFSKSVQIAYYSYYVTWINAQWCKLWTSKVIIRSSYIVQNHSSWIKLVIWSCKKNISSSQEGRPRERADQVLVNKYGEEFSTSDSRGLDALTAKKSSESHSIHFLVLGQV